jgi:hypothetical protein
MQLFRFSAGPTTVSSLAAYPCPVRARRCRRHDDDDEEETAL